jgi:hypothetical protein
MSCCGKQRANWKGESSRVSRAQPASSQFVYFRYAGTGTITIRGSVTGHAYRFSGIGSTIAADARDAPYIAGVPLVERVSNY